MDIFKAISQPTRKRIVNLLARHGQMTVSDICIYFKVSPAAISQHLKVLKNAGLVTIVENGKQRIYHLDLYGISQIENWAKQTKRSWDNRYIRLDEAAFTGHIFAPPTDTEPTDIESL